MAPFRFVFLLFISSFFVLGLYDYLLNYEENGCEMTYMYERPQYLEVKLKPAVAAKYPRYSLYLYGEGQYAQVSRSMALTGIPVLFIPGNAGSHRQVRSLGSVAYRMAKSMGAVTHFDYFSVDFDEDLSGLFGGVLKEQTEFVHECVQHILDLYATATHKPKTVVLVGHSMGGIIARGVFALPTFDSSLVHTIITQATPHQSPVINIDSYMNDYYNNVNEYWRSHVNTTLKQTIVVSSGGGWRDVLVRPGSTALHSVVPEHRRLTTNTLSIPKAWVSTDHLCHVWCKQVVLATQRALFDIIDRNSRQIARNPSYRMNAMRHHFMNHTGAINYKATLETKFKLDASIKWETRRKKSWKLNRDSISSTRYSVVPVPVEEDMSFIAISNIKSPEWIGSCLVTPQEKTCSEVTNFSPWSALIPPMSLDRKIVHVSHGLMQGNTHVVIVMPKTKERTEVVAELYNVTRRHIHYLFPSIAFYFISSNITPPTEVIVNRTEARAVFYNITLIGLNMPNSAYHAHLIPIKCEEGVKGDQAGSVMRLHVPWDVEDTYSFIRYGESGNLSVKLMSGRPPSHSRDPELHLYLHPGCQYHVSLTRSWTESLGQFVRFYGSMLPAFMVIQVLMALSWQLKELDEEGQASSFLVAHMSWAQPYRVGPVAMLLRFLISYPEENNISQKLGLPQDDVSILTEQGLYAAYIVIFLYLIAYASFELYAAFVQVAVGILSRICQKLCAGCCLSLRGIRNGTIMEYVLLVVATLLSAFVCGTAGLIVVYFIFLAKVIWSHMLGRLQQDNLGERAWTRFNINFTLLLLLLLTVILNSPSLIMWIKSMGAQPTLHMDPSRYTGICVAVSALLLTFVDFPRPITELYGVASAVIYMSCVLMVLYSTVSVYRVSYFIAANMLIISLPLVLLITVVTLKAHSKPPTSPDEEVIKKGDKEQVKGDGKDAQADGEEGKKEAKPQEDEPKKDK